MPPDALVREGTEPTGRFPPPAGRCAVVGRMRDFSHSTPQIFTDKLPQLRSSVAEPANRIPPCLGKSVFAPPAVNAALAFPMFTIE